MPIFGTDTSRYQPLGSYDPGEFEIVNAEEPDGNGGDFTATIEKNINDGRPWGIYVWAYPGQRARLEAAVARVEFLFGKVPPLGYWLDYEQHGCEQWQIDAFREDALRLGVKAGLYTYLFILPTVDPRDLPLWLAYYPRRNDGSYPADQIGDALAAGAVMWQFTSSANAPVGLDRNVVIDEDWYRSWLGIVHRQELGPERVNPRKVQGMYVVWSVRDEAGVEVAVGSSVDGVLRHGNLAVTDGAGTPVVHDRYAVISEADWAAAWAS